MCRRRELRGASYLCTSALNASHVSTGQKHVAVSADAVVACTKRTCWVSVALHRVSRPMSVMDRVLC